MPCEVWSKLMERCYKAEKAYHRAVTDASGRVDVEFDRAYQRAEKARKACLDSEKALRDHEQMHGCLRASGREHGSQVSP